MGTKNLTKWQLVPVEKIDARLFLSLGRYLPHIEKEQREWLMSLPFGEAKEAIFTLRNHLYYRKAKDGRPYKPAAVQYIQHQAARHDSQ
jgi:hypothetical protein